MPQQFSAFETKLMKQLLQKAVRYKGETHPNPVVAACVYRDQKVIAFGEHQKKGENHAEVQAIKAAKQDLKGASIMITLEPCTHTGATPPCVDAIIAAGITNVIYAIEDPFKVVKEKKAKYILQQHGIKVSIGLCQQEALLINHNYFYFHYNNRPWIHLKAATTLDGKIALSSGESKYITSPDSRQHVHQLRAQCNAIMIGKNTLDLDNPKLTIRYNQASKKHIMPTIIVVASSLDLTKKYQIFKSGYPTMLVTSNKAYLGQKSYFSKIVYLPKDSNQFNWQGFFELCVKDNIYSVFLEGGAQLYSAALNANVVNKCSFFIAPKIMGQSDAVSVATLDNIQSLTDVTELKNVSIKTFGSDVCITGTL